MIKTARQLKDLIRNLSKEKVADAQLLMRNYMMERFLERISLSEYRDKFILKGGMLVAALVGLDARSTMDLDTTVKGATVSPEDVERMITEILSVPLDDGEKFRIKRISEIMDEAEYPGIRVSMETEFDHVITPLKLDISTGDVITPREVKYCFKLMYQSGVSENHGLLDHHDGTAQTMLPSARGSALVFAVQRSGYSQGFLLSVLPTHQAAVW